MLSIRKIIDLLIFGNIFVSLCVAMLSAETLLLLDYPVLTNPVVSLSFFSTLFIYNYQRVFSYRVHDSRFISIRHNWINQNKRLSLWLVMLSICGIIASLIFVAKEIYFILVPLFIISFFYSTRLPTQKDLSLRFREVPFIKIVLISLVWSAVIAILPIVQQERTLFVLSIKSILIFGGQFFFVFAITLPFDVRDLELDKQKGVKTIPGVIGLKATKWMMFLCSLLSFCCWYIYFRNNTGMDAAEFYGVTIAIVITTVVILLTSIKRNEYFYAFWVEGLSALQFLCILAANFLVK